MTKTLRVIVLTLAIAVFGIVPAFAGDNLAAKFDKVLDGAKAAKNWQIKADDLKGMLGDVMVIDVRTPKKVFYDKGHIPGSIHIPISKLFEPATLAKLPKDKKIVLACVTGQIQNMPIVPLRVLGYDAYTLQFGYASWKYKGKSGSIGAKSMRKAMGNARAKKFPLEK